MKKYFLQRTIFNTFDLIHVLSGKILLYNVDINDYEFIKNTGFVTDKNKDNG